VGDDLTIHVNAGNQQISIGKRIGVDQSERVDRIVGQYVAFGDSFSVPIQATIIERDPVYNDTGFASGNFVVALDGSSQQPFSLKIQVAERGGLLGRGGPTAIFTLTFTANLREATLYVPPQDDGFLVVRMEPDKSRQALPEALALQLDRIEAGRDYFTIREGLLRGRSASVTHKEDGASRLSSTNPHTGPAKLQYSLGTKRLSVLGTSLTYQAVDDPKEPLPRGVFDIEIPDAPHRGGRRYPESAFARTWFRIGHTKDRFIHTGSRSAGCVTVEETGRWDELYGFLVNARKGDNISVGTLEVID